MTTAVERQLVRTDMQIAVVFVVLGVATGWMLGVSGVTWVVALPMAALVAAVEAASDRTRIGLLASKALAYSMIATAVLGVTIESFPAGVFPPATAGFAVGTGLNRLAFGVLGPIPEERRRRLEAAE